MIGSRQVFALRLEPHAVWLMLPRMLLSRTQASFRLDAVRVRSVRRGSPAVPQLVRANPKDVQTAASRRCLMAVFLAFETINVSWVGVIVQAMAAERLGSVAVGHRGLTAMGPWSRSAVATDEPIQIGAGRLRVALALLEQARASDSTQSSLRWMKPFR